MEFIEAPAFSHYLSRYLEDEDYRTLQARLAGDPVAGDVMPGTGGFRKLRWRDRRRGKGSRGGLRVIYFYFESEQQIWLMTLFDKDEASDLSASQKRALKLAIAAESKARGTAKRQKGTSRRS